MQLTQNQANELADYKDRINDLTWVRMAIYLFEEILRRIPEQDYDFSMFRFGVCHALLHLENELVAAHIYDGHVREHILRKQGSVYPLATVLAMNWEHTLYPDKNDAYPVPHDPNYHGWDGPNLEMRTSLIHHCLAYLRYQRSILEHRS